ncbi:LysR family transcriptional regulator [Amorphus orientalis]|uniref:DNA-binding transcriptional LysR family regulator n=1 Tax=Amorphus orientalis TaxID=649198 RepID=A0AAE3VNB1_9HYPH|nr:LysR family transcriptional regulator [Amorphus orientalis]MDQ0315063.1 DNA-binding transcriptional LysR family regulator [Amorphus orientalis]
MITLMNISSFDLNLLKVFDALMRERSATRAGRLVGMSQPAVSNALHRMRNILGDELFVRRGSEMVPTPRAEAMSVQVSEALARIDQAIAGDATFDPHSAERLFTLYGADFFSSLLMPPLMRRVSAAAPNIALRFLESATGEVERLLRDNVIDLALERELPVPDWISRQPILISRFVVLAARGNRHLEEAGVRPGEPIPLGLFCALPQALRSVDGSMIGMVDDALARLGRTRRVMLALPHFHSVAVAVAESELIAALPNQTAEVAAGTLAVDTYLPPIEIRPQNLHMYWHRRDDHSPAHCWLRMRILDAVDTLRSDGPIEGQCPPAPAGTGAGLRIRGVARISTKKSSVIA